MQARELVNELSAVEITAPRYYCRMVGFCSQGWVPMLEMFRIN
jgi:hypothetical protein